AGSDCFRLASTAIVHETFEDEVVIADRTSGRYYGLQGIGAKIWQSIIEGQSVRDIIVVLAGRYGAAEAEMAQIVDGMCREMLDERIIASSGHDSSVARSPSVIVTDGSPPPPAEPGPDAAFVTSRQRYDAYGCFPSTVQALLLRAALLDAERARDALDA